MNLLMAACNQLALIAMRQSGVIVALFVIAIVFMMITPLPTVLVDILIAINICIASLMIMLAMHLPRPLAFSTFPSVLLLTTLFRLALSISTTRLILLDQDAGHIVEAFGQFVVGGNLAVGMVIFLILTIVNFMVITKGSERVAEVGARFTLDAMPGKQMSIDSDLRANLITVDDARSRRADLAKESQLFGAMDGAMKFVHGDAIASLIIVFVNLVGGITIGVVQRNMAVGDAVQLYSVLSIGDGLIAQIPALLISVTAGMVITRVPNQDIQGDPNVGREIAEQFTSQPRAWILSSFAMMGFAALPGMPSAVFIVVAILSGGGGYLQLRRAKTNASAHVSLMNVPPEQNRNIDVRSFNPSRPFVLEFHPEQKLSEVQMLISDIRACRNRLVVLYGYPLPSFIIEQNNALELDEFRFSINEVVIVQATFTSSKIALEETWDEDLPTEAHLGEIHREEDRTYWIEADHPAIENSKLKTISSHRLIVERVELALRAKGPLFIGMRESKAILAWLERDQPELAQEMQRVVPLARFSAIIQRLAMEGVPLRSIRQISETLMEYGQYEREVGALVDYVRVALKSQIFMQHAGPLGLDVWLLEPESESVVRDSLRQSQTESYLALDADIAQRLVEYLRMAFPTRPMGNSVMLVAQDIRGPLRALIRDEFSHVPVLSFGEISNTANVNIQGRFELHGGYDYDYGDEEHLPSDAEQPTNFAA